MLAMDAHALALSSPFVPAFQPGWLGSYVLRQGECTTRHKAFSNKNLESSSVRRFCQADYVALFSLEQQKPESRKVCRTRLPPMHLERSLANGGQGHSFSTNAVPTEAVSAVVTVAVVGAAVAALRKLSKEKSDSALSGKTECEACNGSGLCSSCNGEGFVLKNPSPEAAARARAMAKDAATRYTAGLAKKWSYCTNCSGSRGCPSCQGRGWVA